MLQIVIILLTLSTSLAANKPRGEQPKALFTQAPLAQFRKGVLELRGGGRTILTVPIKVGNTTEVLSGDGTYVTFVISSGKKADVSVSLKQVDEDGQEVVSDDVLYAGGNSTHYYGPFLSLKVTPNVDDEVTIQILPD